MADSLQFLASRIAALEAIDAIKSLKARYWRAIDLKAPEIAADCLAPDVHIDFEGMSRFDSRDAYYQVIKAAAGDGGYHMHHGQNPEIRLVGDGRAEGQWDIRYQGIFPGARVVVEMAGVYRDRYIYDAGRWWIASMTMRQTSFITQTISEKGEATYTSLPDETRKNVSIESVSEA